jgi:hypothetical protein
MDRKQTAIAFALMGIALLGWTLAPFFGGAPSLPALAESPLLFDAARAHALTKEFVTRFPRRVFGSLEARQSTGYIQQYLKALGYEMSYTHFEQPIAGRRQVGRNVLALRRGPNSRTTMVVAHYDTAPTTVQGAMDNGSGVGVLLELARVFSGEPIRNSILFVASDGEEWGMLGTGDLAASYPERGRIAAVLSLDCVAIGELASIDLGTDGQMAGYSPGWLRELLRRSVRFEKLEVSEPAGLREHLDRAFLISGTDQGPFLAQGIPAINLGSRSRDARREWEVWHSPADTAENLRQTSIDAYGRVAERALRTLDRLQETPPSKDEFRFTGSGMVSGRAMNFLHLLAFLPSAAALWFHVANHRRYLSGGRLRRELLAYAGTVLPFLAFYYFITLVYRMRLLPRYPLYPATAKSPVLSDPNWGVLSTLLGLALAVAVACYFIVRTLNRSLPRPDFHVSKLVLLLILAVVALLAFLHNPYWAVSFLVLPAWIWALVDRADGTGPRAANCIWILAAGVVYYMVTAAYAARLGLGWNFIWYEVLAVSTGLFTLPGYMLASAAFALAIRFLAIHARATPARSPV